MTELRMKNIRNGRDLGKKNYNRNQILGRDSKALNKKMKELFVMPFANMALSGSMMFR